jgi:hypothetical protein
MKSISLALMRLSASPQTRYSSIAYSKYLNAHINYLSVSLMLRKVTSKRREPTEMIKRNLYFNDEDSIFYAKFEGLHILVWTVIEVCA